MGYDIPTTLTVLSIILAMPILINAIPYMILRIVKDGSWRRSR